MANLSTQNIGANYKGILNLGSTINTPLSTTLQNITDGDGNTSPLQLATNGVNITPSTLTGSSATSALSISQTWNTTGNPTLIFANVTNTASGATANLIDLQVGGVSQFNVSKGGLTTSRAGFEATAGGLAIPSGNAIRWGLQSAIINSGNGIIGLYNTAINDFNRLQFGGTTSSFPSLKRNGTAIQVRLADDTGFTFIEDLYRRAGSGSPEGVVTAPVGATYHNTTGGAGTSFYVKESGSGNTGWIAK